VPDVFIPLRAGDEIFLPGPTPAQGPMRIAGLRPHVLHSGSELAQPFDTCRCGSEPRDDVGSAALLSEESGEVTSGTGDAPIADPSNGGRSASSARGGDTPAICCPKGKAASAQLPSRRLSVAAESAMAAARAISASVPQGSTYPMSTPNGSSGGGCCCRHGLPSGSFGYSTVGVAPTVPVVFQDAKLVFSGRSEVGGWGHLTLR
jgi:hypothetical protein